MKQIDYVANVKSWAVQIILAKKDAIHAQKWKPEAFLERIEELHWTRRQFDDAEKRALAAGVPKNSLNFRRLAVET
jgi:hypothetical protein